MPDASASGTSAPAPVRLVQRVVEVDGRRVGVATAGRGTPLVMVHGFGVESLLYAQPLARLVGLGFRVYALDIAGHGATDSVGMCAALDGYCDLVERTVEQLGIQRALFMGHSMGGRIVAEVVARDPQRAIALVLLDPIAGASWDAMRPWLRWFPPALALYGAAAVVDVTSTLPALVDARQAIKIGRRVRQSVRSIVTEPWNGLMAGAAVLRATPSVDTLERVGADGVPSVVIQGSADLLVPESAARDAAARLGATYVSVEGGRHSWMVRDPEALPAIVETLLDGVLGDAMRAAGITDAMSLDERNTLCLRADRTPDTIEPVDVVLPTTRRAPRFGFRVV